MSLTTAIVVVVALVDSQLTFCSMQYLKKSSLKHHQNHNETVSDIEYIIPRVNKCVTIIYFCTTLLTLVTVVHTKSFGVLCAPEIYGNRFSLFLFLAQN